MKHLFCLLLALIWVAVPAYASAYDVVIVDAGHGAPDGGSVGYSGTEEKDLNLAVASLIRTWYEFLGVPFLMTREGNDAIFDSDAETIREKKVSDLKNRAKIAENTESPLFISIHMNASPAKNAHGLQVFFAPSLGSDLLASELTAYFSANLSNQRVKEPQAAPKSVYLMKHLSCPAVILEYGFITNAAEEQLLLKSDYQQRLAYLTVCGTLRFINDKG